MSTLAWFEEFSDIYQSELKSLADAGVQFVEDADSKKIGILNLDIEISVANSFNIKLEQPLKLHAKYPDNYPFFKPEVFAEDLQLPRHQNPFAKNLCLLGRGTDKWIVGETLSEYLSQQLPKVLQKGLITDPETLKEDPDEQAEPISDYFKNPGNLLIMSAFPDFISGNSKAGSFRFELQNYTKEFSFEASESILKVIITTWKDQTGKSVKEFKPQSGNFEVPWVRIDGIPLDKEKRDSLFSQLLKEYSHRSLSSPIKIKGGKISMVLGLTFSEEQVKGVNGAGWIFLVVYTTKRPGSNTEEKRIIAKAGTRIAKEDYQQRIPQLHNFTTSTISIAGLGSLGAPAAIEFAKNGVQRMKLLDFDTVEPSSTVRWPLGLEYAGKDKGEALRDFIQQNYPSIEIELFAHRIGAPREMNMSKRSEKEILNSFLQDSSLVLDCTGELGVSNLLFYEARLRNLPFITMEGTPGVWGGLITRSIPKLNKGCWMCFRNHFMDGTIPLPPQDPNASVQTGGCGDVTFIGTSFELQNISLAGIRLAASTLCEGQDGYKSAEWDVAVLSLVNPEKNSLVLPSWKEFQISKHPKCSYCNEK